MQRERKIGVLRRFVVGLAVAAIVAPAAQARVDELGGGAEGSTARTAVIKGDDKAIVSGNDGSAILIGDDKVIVPWTGDSTVLIHGDDKVFAPQGGNYALADYRRALPQDYGDPTAVLVGDDKVIVPGPSDSTVLIHGDDKVFAPQGGNYALADYRRALPQDYGDPTAVLVGDDKVIVPGPSDSTVLIHGDDKVFAPQGGDSTVLVHGDDKVIAPQPGDYTLAGYRRALPQDYGDPTSIPVGGLTSPGTFDWGDAFVGAGVAFALMLLAGGAALGTRRRDRPAAA